MGIKRSDVYALYNVVGNADFDTPIKTSFRYALSTNLKKAKAEMETTDELFPAPENYEAYIKARIAVFEKFGVKLDQTGQPSQQSLSELPKEKIDELNTEMTQLIDDSEEVLEQVKKINEEKIKFLEENVDLDFKQFPINDIPNISDKNGDAHWEIWRLIELFIKE